MSKQTNKSVPPIHPDESASIEQPSPVSLVPPDPNDIRSLRATPPLAMTKLQMTNMPMSTKPPKDKFIRICPFRLPESGSQGDYHNCYPVNLFEYKFPGEFEPRLYCVRPGTDVSTLLTDRGKLFFAILVMGLVRKGGAFIWGLKQPRGLNILADLWAHSRNEVAKTGETQWIKPFKSKSGTGFDFETPVAIYDDPDWSKFDFDQAIKAACKDRIIESVDHEAVKESLGL